MDIPLEQELREPAIYYAVAPALAGMASRSKEASKKLGISCRPSTIVKIIDKRKAY